MALYGVNFAAPSTSEIMHSFPATMRNPDDKSRRMLLVGIATTTESKNVAIEMAAPRRIVEVKKCGLIGLYEV